MGLSRAFGCFKDTDARAPKRQKKARKPTRNEEARPNRVVAAAGRGPQPGSAMRDVPGQPAISVNVATRYYESPSLEPGDDEPEPWSVGAVIRRTSMLQAKLAEAANERKRTEEGIGAPDSRTSGQVTVEEDIEIPTTETNPEVVGKDKGEGETSTGETTGGSSGVRATMIFGVPTTKQEPKVDLRAIEEEAELRKLTEEQNALAAKGSHSGKYGGAVSWDPAHSQRATPVSLQGRDTRKSGWGRPGVSESAMDEQYYDYGIGMSSNAARSPVGRSPYGSPYGHLRQGTGIGAKVKADNWVYYRR
ncbi:hypothetical protein N431DRAFT_52426 [Stipitochalara longipes BDJ]|nr:hypothetical protein N431DRAFT_52426 [Stipitochalara longipes BDJ]